MNFKRKFICFWFGCKSWDQPGVCSKCGLGWQFRFGSFKEKTNWLIVFKEWIGYLIK